MSSVYSQDDVQPDASLPGSSASHCATEETSHPIDQGPLSSAVPNQLSNCIQHASDNELVPSTVAGLHIGFESPLTTNVHLPHVPESSQGKPDSPHSSHNATPLASLSPSTVVTTPSFHSAYSSEFNQLPIALGGVLPDRDSQPIKFIPRQHVSTTGVPVLSSLSGQDEYNSCGIDSSELQRSDSVLATVYYTARTSIPRNSAVSRASTFRSIRSINSNALDTLGTSILLNHTSGVTNEHNPIGDPSFLTELEVEVEVEEEVGYEDELEEEEEGESTAQLPVEAFGGNGDEQSTTVYGAEEYTLTEDDLNHLPPYLPDIQPYLGFGRSLRETVLYRQNSRVFPPNDRLQERMEDQLIRWSAPQSLFHMEEILNGKHAFQKDDTPVLEVLVQRPKDVIPHSSGTLENNTPSSEGELTNSTVESICKSAFLLNRASPLKKSLQLKEPLPAPSSMFHEDNRNNNGTDSSSTQLDLANVGSNHNSCPGVLPSGLGVIFELDLSSIQESPPYMYEPRSPSFTASMRLHFNPSFSHLNSPTDNNNGSTERPTTATAVPVVLDDGDRTTYLESTPIAEALPVTLEEVRSMVKNPPPLLPPMVQDPQAQLRRHVGYANDYYGDDDDVGYCLILGEIFSTCWDDTYSCLSFRWLFDDENGSSDQYPATAPDSLYHV